LLAFFQIAAAAKENIKILQKMLDLKIDPNAKQMDDVIYNLVLGLTKTY